MSYISIYTFCLIAIFRSGRVKTNAAHFVYREGHGGTNVRGGEDLGRRALTGGRKRRVSMSRRRRVHMDPVHNYTSFEDAWALSSFSHVDSNAYIVHVETVRTFISSSKAE